MNPVSLQPLPLPPEGLVTDARLGTGRGAATAGPSTTTGRRWVLCALPALSLLAAGCAVQPTPTTPREVLVAKATCPAASYPEEAKRLGATGQTEVEMEVNPEGKVTRVAIARSSGNTPGHQALDALALNTLTKCTFPPAPGFLSGSGRMVYVWKLDN